MGLRIIDQVDNADPSDYGAGHTRQACQNLGVDGSISMYSVLSPVQPDSARAIDRPQLRALHQPRPGGPQCRSDRWYDGSTERRHQRHQAEQV